MSYVEAAALGLLQGVAEWLPVSSEGLVAAVYALAFGGDVSDAVSFALWLHAGTALSALVAFRREVADVCRDALTRPLRPSPLTAFLVVATVASAPVGFVALVALDSLTARVGSVAMAMVGAMMLATGVVLLRRRADGTRTRDDSAWPDAVPTGLAQGLAALPGLSRSGLTVSVLLARGFHRREALALSMLMSVPASLAAALYAAIDSGASASPQAVVALAVAAVVGFATIKTLLAFASRVELGWFVIIVGVAITAGAIWQAAT